MKDEGERIKFVTLHSSLVTEKKDMAAHKKQKLRVGVIFGGRSGEHEVSLRSARSVIDALNKEKYDVVPIGITKEGQWITGEALAALTADPAQTNGYLNNQEVILPPSPGKQTLIPATSNHRPPTDNQQPATTGLDVIIPVLHGTFGEDGTVQGLLELAGIPYVGAGVVGSAVSMDKIIFKYVMEANQLPILPWEAVLSQAFNQKREMVLDRLESQLFYPMFVKPANLGSSVGVSKCLNRAELEAGLADAARYDRRLVVEQGAEIRELEVSVLGNEHPIASTVGEIRPKRDFYDYEAKYVTDDSELLIPAPLDPALADQVRQMAIRVYTAVDCAGLGRVDMMFEEKSGKLYVNEINTLPGFTSISMYPKLWEATDLPYSDLLDKLIALALERHAVKSELETEFKK